MTLKTFGAALVVLAASVGVNAGPQQSPPPAAATPEVKVVTTESIHALVLPMKGSYEQHQSAFERLSAQLSARGAAPAGAPFGRYFSDPSVGDANLVWEVGFPVAQGVTAEAPFEVKDIPGTLTAVRLHTGPLQDLGTAWGSFIQWLFANGYQPVGPAMQMFKGDMVASPQIEMRIPVAKP